MFSAVLRGKAGHWFEGGVGRAGRPWRAAIRIEDSLTALVFDALATLPGSSCAALLEAAMRPSNDLGWLAADDFVIDFWRTLHDGTQPDVLVVSEQQQQVLIVEAKHESVQSAAQLRREQEAVRAAFDGYSIALAAAGGENVHGVVAQLRARKDADAFGPVVALSWRTLADVVRRGAGEADTAAERRCLAALLEGLEWFGYRRFDGFRVRIPDGWSPELVVEFQPPTARPAAARYDGRWMVDLVPLSEEMPPGVASDVAGWRLVHV